jgi:hypothetical protein
VYYKFCECPRKSPHIVYLYSNMCGHIRTENKCGERSEREREAGTHPHTNIHTEEERSGKEEKCKSGSRQATRLCAQAVEHNGKQTFYAKKSSSSSQSTTDRGRERSKRRVCNKICNLTPYNRQQSVCSATKTISPMSETQTVHKHELLFHFFFFLRLYSDTCSRAVWRVYLFCFILSQTLIKEKPVEVELSRISRLFHSANTNMPRHVTKKALNTHAIAAIVLNPLIERTRASITCRQH